MSVHILLADDHPTTIEGLAKVLPAHGIKIVATTDAAEKVFKTYEDCSPDVVVLDVRFGGEMTGLEVARKLIFEKNAKIIFFSQFDKDEVIQEMYKIGGMGLVTKNKHADLLADAIKSAEKGKVFFQQEIAERMALMSVRTSELVNPRVLLDERELIVFKMLAAGKTTLEISEELGLSIKTISKDSNSVKEKLGVQRSAEITRLAIKTKLLEP